MKVGIARLEAHLGKSLAVDDVVERLTMAGLEVDGVDAGKAVEGVVVGRVAEVRPHPDADKLKVCVVEAGDEPVEVVCGAPNVRVGMLAPFAKVGAQLGDLKIKRAKLRGVESHGMLCSAEELGLSDEAEGLLELEGGAPGDPLPNHARRSTVLDLDLTPNRPDCFSVRGVARELAALDGRRLLVDPPPERDRVQEGMARLGVEEGEEFGFAIDVREPQACPRYLACVIRGLPPDLRTPTWARECLWAGGMQLVHPIVDMLNAQMLEIGQPMHAFDLDKIKGGLVVRFANAGEKMTALGGEPVSLPDDCLVIADDEGAVAAAGIIGGERAAVTAETSNILLECAFFAPDAIAGRARAMRLHTEASLRFERGVDPQMQGEALTRAMTSVVESALNVQIGAPIVRCDEKRLPVRKTVTVTQAEIEKTLGVEISPAALSAHLTAAGCVVDGDGDTLKCTPPSWRFDLNLAADLIEEAGRFYGYDRVPATREAQSFAPGVPVVDRLSDALCAAGYREVINLSFGAPEEMAAFADNADDKPLVLDNPIAPDLAAMRTSLWPGLIRNLRHNLNRGRESVRLFECGKTFSQSGDQAAVIAGLAYGTAEPEQWGVKTRRCDFFDVKGDLEMLFDSPLSSRLEGIAGLHGGQAVEMWIDDKAIGCIGPLSPEKEAELDVPSGVILFELYPNAISFDERLKVREVSKYPSVRNDISIVVQDDMQVVEMLEHVETMKVKDLQKVQVFDVFQGGDIEKDKKSISLYLIYQSFDSTLKGEDVAERTRKIVQALCKKFHGEQR